MGDRGGWFSNFFIFFQKLNPPPPRGGGVKFTEQTLTAKILKK